MRSSRRLLVSTPSCGTFSYIHSIVTGVLHVDLESALQKPGHDATFDAPDAYGRRLLFWAAFQGDTESVRLLLRKGEYLLCMGADIEWHDKNNNSQLVEAVRYSNTAIVEVLLRHGAKVDYVNSYGQTMPHLATNWANVQTVEVLAEARLEGLGTESRDCKGWTAWEVFEARAAQPDGFDGAFGKLIDRVKRSEMKGRLMLRRKTCLSTQLKWHDLVESLLEGVTP